MNGTTLDTILRRLARERGTKVALRYGDAVLTYAELDARACRVARCTSCPCSVSCPRSGVTNPVMHLKSVVFPAPLGPRIPKNSP